MGQTASLLGHFKHHQVTLVSDRATTNVKICISIKLKAFQTLCKREAKLAHFVFIYDNSPKFSHLFTIVDKMELCFKIIFVEKSMYYKFLYDKDLP